MIASALFLMAPTVLPTFLEAYYVVAERLAARAPATAVDEKSFLDECMAVGRQWVMQQRLNHPEALSRELFANALKLVANRGLLEPGDATLVARRIAFARECASHVQAINELGRLRLDPANMATTEPAHARA